MECKMENRRQAIYIRSSDKSKNTTFRMTPE